MKKIILLALFLAVALLLCPPSTQAAGGSVEEKINIDPCAWWMPPAYHYLLDTIGCPCDGFDPMVWNPGNKYCYNKALNLDVRECTEGGHEHWNWSGGWYQPSQPCNADDPNYPNCECLKYPDINNYHGTFCEDLRCNSCLNVPDDPECDALGKSRFPSGNFTSKCLKGEYTGQKSKECYWCVRYTGSGEASTKKITFVGIGGYPSEEKVINKISNTEPFKYLISKKKLTLQFISAHKQSTLSSDQEHGAHPLVKPLKYEYDNTKIPPRPTYYTEETKENIKRYVNMVCPGTDYIVVLDSDWKFSSYASGYAANFTYWDGYKSQWVTELENIVFIDSRASFGDIILHELGHAIGKLDDEYDYAGMSNQYSNGSINLDTYSSDGACNKFDNYLVPRANCFWLSDRDYTLRKSTRNSIMHWGSSYNIIGCAAMLNALDGTSFPQAVAYCRDTPTSGGYKIYDGVVSQECLSKEEKCIKNWDCCSGSCVSGVCQ